MALTKQYKAELISSFQAHDKDTGTPAVQVALLTKKILVLTDHLKTYSKDYASRRGLFKMVGQRRKLLNYLKKYEQKTYQTIIEKLEIRK